MTKPQVRYQPAQFRLRSLPGVFAGYTSGRVRNGWACPVFEHAEALRLVEALSADDGEAIAHYDERDDCFVFAPDAVPDVFDARLLPCADGVTRKLYRIGTGVWDWEDLAHPAQRRPDRILAECLSVAEMAEQALATGRVEGVVAIDLDEIVGLDLEGFLDLLSERLIGNPLLMDTAHRVAGSLGDTVFIRVDGQVDLSYWAEELAMLGIDWDVEKKGQAA
jgi:hypothetical protein